jgi:hypothetical protein
LRPEGTEVEPRNRRFRQGPGDRLGRRSHRAGGWRGRTGVARALRPGGREEEAGRRQRRRRA